MSIRMPDRLRGPWQHALFTTYTIDLGFLEHMVWWPLQETCRNVVVLADEQRLLEACEEQASRRLITHLNRRYLVDGLRFPGAAHPKVVLLTNESRGRLLVGSGNLGPRGWVRGGEVFTEYEFSEDAPEQLAAFVVVRDLLVALLEGSQIAGLARERVEALLEETPWLYQGGVPAPPGVLHNLSRNLFGQLVEAVGGRRVEELRVLSPFYDPGAVALETMLSRFAPERCDVYVEPGCTSVDWRRLATVRDAHAPACRVRPYRRDGCDYVHAKAYLLKLSDGALLLTGSPNLSRAALLSSAANGNLEVASILTGARDEFDGLFDELLAGEPQNDLSQLGLRPPETSEDEAGSARVVLLRAVLGTAVLELCLRGDLPDPDQLTLQMGPRAVALEGFGASLVAGILTVPLSDELREALAAFHALRLQWRDGRDPVESNAVFVMDRSALTAELRSSRSRVEVSAFTDVPMDEALLAVVMPLERLFGDYRGAWRAAVRASNPTPTEDEEQRLILYDDVDLIALRQHPKIQQYLHTHGAAAAGEGGHWNVLDNVSLSVSEFFRQFAQSPGKVRSWEPDVEAIAEEDIDPDEDDVDRRRVATLDLRQRREQAVRRFMHSCLVGVTSEGFREIAGYVFVSRVYAVFHHTLLRFAEEGWVDLAFVGENVEQLWHFYWGTVDQPGYFYSASEAERQLARAVISDYGEEKTLLAMLAALSVAGMPNRVEPLADEQRLAIRDVLRGLLLREPLTFDAASVEAAAVLCSRFSLEGSVAGLAILASLLATERHDTPSGFVRQLVDLVGPAAKGAGFVEGIHCHRPAINQDWSARCFEFIYDAAVDTPDKAIEVLRFWMRWQPELPYYRLCYPPEDAVHLAFYDRVDGRGAYKNRQGGGIVKFGPLTPWEPEWQPGIEHLRDAFLAAEAIPQAAESDSK